MQISRRGALLGATAAAAVTGLTVAPLSMKAAGVKVALASADPQIEALIGQLRAANALYDDNSARYDAATALIPGYPTEIGTSPEVMANYNRQYQACGARALAEQSELILDRISDIQAQIIQTPATTLRATLGKARIFWSITALHEDLDETNPDLENNCPRLDDPQFIWSMLRDLERLAGEARS